MKNIFVAIAVGAFLTILGTTGHCQYTERDDSAIEQSESQMGQNLESEIGSDKSQGQAEMGEANEESAAGEAMTL